MNPAFLGILTASVWGAHDLIAGITSRRIGFLPTVLGSTFFGLLVLTVWLAIAGDYPDPLHGNARIAYASGVGYALATMFLFAALSAGPMSLGVPIAGSFPVTSLALAALFGNPPTLVQLALAATVILGVVIVSMADHSSPNQEEFGEGWFKRTVLCGAAAHVLFALGIWLGQMAAVDFGSIETTWLARISGFVVLLMLFRFRGQTLAGKGRELPVMALLGVLDVLAISCLNFAGVTDHPEIATVIGSTFGPVTVLLAWIFLRERIPPARWLGIAVTFSGVAGLTAMG